MCRLSRAAQRECGAFISGVAEGSQAAALGVVPSGVIVEVAGRAVAGLPLAQVTQIAAEAARPRCEAAERPRVCA